VLLVNVHILILTLQRLPLVRSTHVVVVRPPVLISYALEMIFRVLPETDVYDMVLVARIRISIHINRLTVENIHIVMNMLTSSKTRLVMTMNTTNYLQERREYIYQQMDICMFKLLLVVLK
jgi:hypothetical protein